MSDKWEDVVAALREHPKTKELPEGLITVSGDMWQREAKQLNALREYLPTIGITVPEELLQPDKLEDLVHFLKRSSGQSSRRKRDTEVVAEVEEQSPEQ